MGADHGSIGAWARAKRLGCVLTAAAFATISVSVSTPDTALALVSPEQLAIRDGLKHVSDALAGLDGLDELGQFLPLSDLLPTGTQGLDVIDSVKDVLDEALAAIDSNSADGAIEDTLNGLDGTSVGGGITAHVVATVTDDDITFTTLEFTRDSTTPLQFATGTLSLDGAALTTSLELSFTANGPLVMRLDTTGTPELYLPDTEGDVAPDATLSANLSLDVDPGLALDLGILAVTATGGDPGVADVSAAVEFTIDWLDPDLNGRISLADLDTAAPLDLWDVSYASSSVDIDLTLAAATTFMTGLAATGSISLHDANLADGLAAPTVDLPELENFTNMTPEDILVAIAQFAVSLQAMQTRVADADLPIIGADPNAGDPNVPEDTKTVDNLSDVLDINDQIGQFFVTNGLSTAESPFELKIGDANDNGTIDPGEVTLDSLGLDDIESIINGLAGFVGDTVDLAYESGEDQLTFTLDFDASYAPPPAILALNDQLSALGLKGLASLSGTAGIGFDADYSIDIGFGIDLTAVTSETPITERLFIDTSGVEVTGDARVSGDVNLAGTLGFLEVSLADTDTDPDAEGFVPLLDRRATDPDNPMVSIDLNGGADDRILLSDLYADLGSIDASAAGNVFTLTGSNATVTGTINAGVPSTTVNASATIGASTLGGATLTFAWPDIFGAPTASGDPAFNDDFLAFNIDSSNPLALFNSIIDAIDRALATVDAVGGDSNALLDQDLPIIGTSFRDSVAFLGTVRDTINEIAQDPAGSLQRLESQVELAIAEGLGVDLSSLGSLPDPNDPAFISAGPDGTPGTGDDVFDDAAFEAALNAYFDAVQNFFTGAMDFVTLGYEPGNSPGAVTMSLKLGVCSTIDAEHPGCTKEIPLSKAFNFDFDAIGGDFAGLIAAESAGELTLDYNAAVQVDLGVQLPDVANGDFTPVPFIADTSFVDLSLAGEVAAAFDATIGPFAIKVGNLDPVAEPATDCGNSTDDDGDGFINDGCAAVGAAETACNDATDDDTQDDTDAGGPATVNDGCDAQAAAVQAQAGASFHLEADFGGDSVPTRVRLLEGSDLTDYLGALATAIPDSLDTNPAVDCGSGPVFACASLPIFVNAGGSDIFLGTIDGAITDLDPFTHTFDPNDITAIKDALLANADNLAWQLIGQGLKEFGNYVEDATKGASYDINIPVIGDALHAGAEIGAAFNNGVAQPVGDALSSTGSDLGALQATLETTVRDALDESGLLLNDAVTVHVFCGGTTVCDPDGAGDTILDVTDVQVRFTIGATVLETEEIPFDFGFPGLRIATADGDNDGDPDGIKPEVTWSIDVGFGLSLEDGFYLVTDWPDSEIELAATVNTPDFTADIAFLGIEIDSDNSDTAKPDGRLAEELALSLAINLPDDGDGKLSLTELSNLDPVELIPVLEANVDLYWHIETAPDFGGASGDNGALPRLLADLNIVATACLGAPSGSCDPTDGFDFDIPEFGFDNVQLDVGSFIGEFLGPVLGEVQNFTKPLQPVIDVVSAPIPGISQLAELVGADPVTLLSLFEAISGNDLTLVKTLLKVITFVNALEALDTGSLGPIDIGEFDIDANAILDTELPANQKSQLISFADPVPGGIAGEMAAIGGDFAAAFADNLSAADPQEFESEEPGFSFPAFDDFSQLFNLIVGQDVSLIRFASGSLRAEFGYSQSFGPIAVGPVPVSIVISGSASIEGRFAVGYDTKGIRQLVQMLTDGDASNDDFLSGFGFLFNGLYLDDLNAAGQDVPEIRLVVEFAAGAAVDLVIISAGVEGGVRATIDMNLHDGGFFEPIPPANLDGKLRLDEVASFLFGNPICLFDVSGKLEAFIRVFVEIDLILFSKRFEFTVVNITLLELDNITAELCEPPPPMLASDIGDGVLRLNMGPNVEARNYSPETTAEKFVVKQLADGTVEVSGFGLTQVFGPNEDAPFQINVAEVVGDGGSDKDTVRFDPAAIESVDGQGNVVSTEVPFSIPTEICGGASDDKVFGGEVTDTYAGDGQQNGSGGGAGWACTLNDTGADGNDEFSGLGGDDNANGGGGVDALSGDSGNDTLNGDAGDDAVNGGIGKDILSGGANNDNIKGGADKDPSLPEDPNEPDVPEDESNDVIDGNEGDDTIDGDFGDDYIEGGSENDVIVAGFGSDTVLGEANEDTIFGNEGDDATLDGGDGDDVILGMVGNDNVRGGGNDDNLFGNEGDDDVEGGDGKDVILGDTGEINRVQDPVESSLARADLNKPLVILLPVSGAAGDTNLSGDGDTDVIYGQEGQDFIEGGAGNDELHGNEDEDTVSGDADADTMFGDAGIDTMWGDNAIASNGCADGADIMHGGDQDDVMSGNGAGDTLFGDNGEDLGYGDADTPNAACDGGDTAYGGPLDDYLFGNAFGDNVNGQGGIDRLVGGNDDFGQPDDGDTVNGGEQDDVIAGDNATIGDDPAADNMLVTLRMDGQGAGDPALNGDNADDRIYGQTGADTINGGNGNDAAEGNDGGDAINGGLGEDDLVGGGSAFDGVVDADRVGNGLLDDADTINGGTAIDWIAGDNALINRNFPSAERVAVELFDVELSGAPAVSPNFHGGDTINGDAAADLVFGQGDGDLIHGNDGIDYVEGNNGDDSIFGDAGNDDLVGGGSADDGKIDAVRVGDNLLDVGETLISGGTEADWITGDNALISRNLLPGAPAPIRLFDVQTTGSSVPSDVSGGDLLKGDAHDDLIFGQGNGAQPATETDPEDDRNNDFVGTTFGNPDFDKSPAPAAVDENGGAAWSGDIVLGGLGDDYIEGNHGNDLLFGNGEGMTGQDEDDIAGGGSANDGFIDDDRLGLGASLLDGFDTIHGDDGNNAAGDDDAVIGDNGWVRKLATKQVGPQGPDGDEVDQFERNTQMTQTRAASGTFANDFISGNGGHDELFGQQGDDYVEGGYGSDAMVGDLGKVTTDLFTDTAGNAACGAARTISPNEPFVQEPVCQQGTLFRLVQLYAFNDTVTNGANAVAAGNDVMLGLDGDDWMHGGPGADLMNGDGDGGAEIDDPNLPGATTIITDPNPASADYDRIFGADSNGSGTVSSVVGGDGDAVWGGRGHDHTYGGRGDDMLEVRPDPTNTVNFPRQWSAWAEADVESYHGVDFVYGGYDQDAMQANVANNGPINGDRLFDWVGAYNIYYLCPATYGAYVSIRDQSPAILAYFEQQAATDGALTPATNGTSGFNELALVYKPDVRNNSHPIYPGTPGHFFCT